MAGFAVVGTVAALGWGHPRAAAGFALGAMVAVLGYSWLHQAVVSLMNQGERRRSRFLPGKLLIRYPLAVVAVFVFYRENWLPFEAVLAGLFIPAAGALAESLYQISAVLLHSKAT